MISRFLLLCLLLVSTIAQAQAQGRRSQPL